MWAGLDFVGSEVARLLVIWYQPKESCLQCKKYKVGKKNIISANAIEKRILLFCMPNLLLLFYDVCPLLSLSSSSLCSTMRLVNIYILIINISYFIRRCTYIDFKYQVTVDCEKLYMEILHCLKMFQFYSCR